MTAYALTCGLLSSSTIYIARRLYTSLLIGREPFVAHHPRDPILKPAGRSRDHSDELASGCDCQAPPTAPRGPALGTAFGLQLPGGMDGRRFGPGARRPKGRGVGGGMWGAGRQCSVCLQADQTLPGEAGLGPLVGNTRAFQCWCSSPM